MASSEKLSSPARPRHTIDPEKQPLLSPSQFVVATSQQEQPASGRGNVLKRRGYLPLCVFALYVIFAVAKGLILANCGLIGSGHWHGSKHTDTSINDDWVIVPELATFQVEAQAPQLATGGGRWVALEAHIMYVLNEANPMRTVSMHGDSGTAAKITV